MTTGTIDATQSGVPGAETTEETKPKELTAREIAMEAIADLRQDSFDTENNGGQPVVKPSDTEDQLQSQFEAPKTLADDDLEKMFVNVKIDGVESEVTVAEMRRRYQKNGAAERRLEEATRLLNEARAATPPVGFAQTTPPNDIQATPGGDDEEGKAFLAALFDGDEEKALAALKAVGFGRPQPTPDAQQLAAQLTPAIKQQLVVDSALEKFEENYADVMADPYLEGIAAEFIKKEMEAGLPFVEALDVGGKKTRDWLTSKGVTTPPPNPTTDRNTKLERKAGIDVIPALNSKATTVEEPEQSATDVINEMRKARGL